MISLIGKSVKSYGDGFSHTSGESSELKFNLATDATTVSVKIMDSSGSEVITLKPKGTFKAGDRSITWDGVNSIGKNSASGNYTFEVTATGANGGVTVETYSTGLVKGITYTGGSPYMMINGQEVALTDVISVEMYQGNSSNSSDSSGNSSTQSSAVNSSKNSIDPNLQRFISRVIGQ
jgi:flagellar basal-body rod modification protein FlgD